MGLLQSIYKHVPVPLQNVMVSVYGYGWRKRRFGGVFDAALHGFKDREAFTHEQWISYQNQELAKMLAYANGNVPFYKAKFSQLGISTQQLRSFGLVDLHKLPFLEKDELRQFGETTLLSQQKAKGEFFASSGSTGTPTKIYYSHEMHQRWSAGFEARIRHWAGVDRFTPRGMIGGRRVLPEGNSKGPYYRFNYAEKQAYFSAYHISAENAPEYLKGIQKHHLQYMTGYAASNFFLARFFDELKLNAPQLKAVITSSEKLTPEMREVFYKVYGCKTYDSYSGVEDCGLISECEFGGLHVSPDMGIIEFLNEEGKPAVPGEKAEIVCTGILNYDQPLIRYRIGDYAVLEDRVCQCGRNMPLVKEIVGRHEDVVVGKDGREMVRFHGIFIALPNIIQGQVIQEDYEKFTLKIVSAKPLSQLEKNTILKRMQSQLGYDILVNIEEVENIPLGPNGKYKAVISKIKRSKT